MFAGFIPIRRFNPKFFVHLHCELFPLIHGVSPCVSVFTLETCDKLRHRLHFFSQQVLSPRKSPTQSATFPLPAVVAPSTATTTANGPARQDKETQAVSDVGGFADLDHGHGTTAGRSSSAAVPAVARDCTRHTPFTSSSPPQGGVLVGNAAKSSPVRRVQSIPQRFREREVVCELFLGSSWSILVYS